MAEGLNEDLQCKVQPLFSGYVINVLLNPADDIINLKPALSNWTNMDVQMLTSQLEANLGGK